MSMKIATWNINSVRIRLEPIAQLVREAAPDILCLQETKSEDGYFPYDALRTLGFTHIYHRGQKSYNGVAILSRVPLANVHHETFVNDDSRHLAATLPDGSELHNFYVPAGGDIPDVNANPKFKHKLDFCDAATQWFTQARFKNRKLILVGDLNIAPLPNDVWSHQQLLRVVSHTPVEVEAMKKWYDTLGWVDVARHFTPHEQKLYSWWSYRNRDWKKSDRGRRLDHIWVTPHLTPQLKAINILRHARDWGNPSDHVPVVAELG